MSLLINCILIKQIFTHHHQKYIINSIHLCGCKNLNSCIPIPISMKHIGNFTFLLNFIIFGNSHDQIWALTDSVSPDHSINKLHHVM